MTTANNSTNYKDYLIPDIKEIVIGIAFGLASPTSYKVFQEAFESGVNGTIGTLTVTNGVNFIINNITGSNVSKAIIQLGVAVPFSIVGGAIISERIGKLFDLTEDLITEAFEKYYLDRKYGIIEEIRKEFQNSVNVIITDEQGRSYKIVDGKYVEVVSATVSNNTQTIKVTNSSIDLENEKFSAKIQKSNLDRLQIESKNVLTPQEKTSLIKDLDLQGKTVTFKNPNGSLEIYKIDDSLIKIADEHKADLSKLLITSSSGETDTLKSREIILQNGGSMYVYRIDDIIKITSTDNDFDYKPIVNTEQYNKYLKDLFLGVPTIKSYQIRSNDTLSKIALNNKTTIERILELNPDIIDANSIIEGQTIKLDDQKVLAKLNNKLIVNDTSYTTHKRDLNLELKSSRIINKDTKFTDQNGDEITQEESLITFQDNDSTLTIIKDNTNISFADGTKALLSSVIEMGEVATLGLVNSIHDSVSSIFNPLFNSIFSNDESSKDENNQTAAQRLMDLNREIFRELLLD